MEYYNFEENIKKNWKVEYCFTLDKFKLALGRYENKGKQPIILMHGLAQNYKIWDFPIKLYNLANYLYSKGYDIWLPCLRGHGDNKEVNSENIHNKWSIDDLAIYDVPSIINKVIEITDKIPIWIGHSLGGMIVYMYLQGIKYKENSTEIISDKELSNQRNKKLKSLITLGSPVKMLGYRENNKFFLYLTRLKVLRDKLITLDSIPFSTLVNNIHTPSEKVFSNILKKGAKKILYKFIESSFSSIFWYPHNMTKNLILTLLHTTLNDINPFVLEQFADWIQHQTFRSFYPNSKGEYYIYNNNFDKIKTPLLMIAGEKDRISIPKVIYEDGYLKMGSKIKKYKCFKFFGHNDMCVGVLSRKIIYPYIEKWINQITKYNKIE